MSMTEMRHDIQKKRITISVKVFSDDMENTLKAVFRKPLVFKHTQADTIHNTYFEQYFESRITLESNKKRLQTDFLGFEYDQDVCWIYLEIPNVRTWAMLQMTNRILFELFEDQQNIMHFYDSKQKRNSYIFNKQEAKQTLKS